MTSTNEFELLPQLVTGPGRTAFQARAKALCKFRMVNKRWPSTIASRESERKLASWHYDQRQYLKAGTDGTMAVERVAYLDAVAPGWRHGNKFRGEAAFNDWAQELVDFRSINGRWPSTRGVDASERVLGGWLVNQRQSFRTGRSPAFTAERVAYLDAVAPGWSDVSRPRGEDAFRARVQTVATFRSNTNRWPSMSAADAAERAMGWWLHNQRRYYKSGTNAAFIADRSRYLDEVLPGWRNR